MLVIGLTGGIGSGKSTALRVFKKLGAFIIDADRLARDVVKPGRPAWQDIRSRFGKTVFNANHTLNRKKLASIVFKDAKALKELNAMIHPRVFEEEKALIGKYSKSGKNAVVVVDAPLMIESGSHKWKDVLVVMKASRESQVARIVKNKGMSRKEAEARIAAQMPLAEKLKYADFVIENDSTLADCRRNAEKVYREILKRHRGK
ncbi:MAG: dephospho-CoA kinase [Nitrospinota bacterium]|nr:dephospho-CoA kinase [Nitrospinota bacterium]